jgi:hypothetical protein
MDMTRVSFSGMKAVPMLPGGEVPACKGEFRAVGFGCRST